MTRFDLIFIGAGAVLFVAGVICAYVASRSEERMAAMQDTPTYSARDIEAIYKANGAYAQPCEVAGTLECDYTYSGPLSDQPCAAYSHTQAWEDWGPAGMFDRRRSAEGMVCRNAGVDLDDRRVPTLWVRDATGRVLVDTLNAELDLKEIEQRYEVTTASIGGSERRVRHTEQALPLGEIYVLGYLGERQGQPIIQRHPSDPSRKFLISYRSEQKLLGAHRLRSYSYYFAAGITGSLGVVLVIWRLVISRGRF